MMIIENASMDETWIATMVMRSNSASSCLFLNNISVSEVTKYPLHLDLFLGPVHTQVLARPISASIPVHVVMCMAVAWSPRIGTVISSVRIEHYDIVGGVSSGCNSASRVSPHMMMRWQVIQLFLLVLIILLIVLVSLYQLELARFLLLLIIVDVFLLVLVVFDVVLVVIALIQIFAFIHELLLMMVVVIVINHYFFVFT